MLRSPLENHLGIITWGYEFEKLSSRVRDNWKKIRRISWMDPGIEEIVSDSTRLVLDSSWFKLFLVI